MPRLLVAIRGDRTQSEAAQLSGLTQSKISRAEAGKFPFDEETAAAYARALGAEPAQIRRLVALAAAHGAENMTGRKQLIRSAHVIQRRLASLEQQTRLLRSWVLDVVPGLAQTADYTRALLGEDPGERWWAARRERLAVVDTLDRELHLLMSEAVLRWGIGSAEIMAAQVAHLAELAGRTTIRLGIVPLDTIHPIAAPRDFSIFGQATAMVATDVGTTFISEPDDIAEFGSAHAELSGLAAYGDDARRLLDRAAQLYREGAASGPVAR